MGAARLTARRMWWIALLIGTVLITLAGCGGGGGSPSGSASSPSAPTALVIAKLLPASALKAAGVAASAVEDDGGYPASGAFVSYARTATSSSNMSVALATYSAKSSAQQTYQQTLQAQAGTSQPLSGAGDKAVSVGMTTYVLKGAQMLTVQGQLTKQASDALNAAKANGTLDPATIAAAQAAVTKDTRNLATAAAAKMSGATAANVATLTYIPVDAIDPCTVPAASLDNGDIHVTSQAVLSDSLPALECIYTFRGSKPGEGGTGLLALYTLTEPQAESAVLPTSVQGYFSAAPQGSSAGGSQGYSTANEGPFIAEGTTKGEPDYVLADINPPPGAVSKLLIRIEDEASIYVIDKDHCEDEIGKMMGDLLNEAEMNGHTVSSIVGDSATMAAFQKVRQDIRAWCEQEAQPGNH